MRILVVAPQPFYQERGTPIAVDTLLQILSARGDKVDVLTYHEGKNREYPNCTIYRIQPLIPVTDIRPGFTFKKLYCDSMLFFKLIFLLKKGKYDILHCIEESAFMAFCVFPFFRIPFIYDMDSLISLQVIDKFPSLKIIQGLIEWFENKTIRSAAAVATVCDALSDEARKRGAQRIITLRDISLNTIAKSEIKEVDDLRALFGIRGGIVMYIGNLEPYQGLDLLLGSFAWLLSRRSADLVIIGGRDDDIAKYKSVTRAMGIEQHVHFLGKRPVSDIQFYMKQADILVSPRIQGTNTPMKIYSYLHSGVAVCATDILSHTQILSADIAKLAEAKIEPLGNALLILLEDDTLRSRLACKAMQFVENNHTFNRLQEDVQRLYDSLQRHNIALRTLHTAVPEEYKKGI